MSPDLTVLNACVEAELMAYVDGHLSADRRQIVERVAETDPETANALRLLQVSRLPYQSAFAQEALPPVPQSLRRRVDDLVQVVEANNALAMVGRGTMPGGQAHLTPWILIAIALVITSAIVLGPALVRGNGPSDPIAPWIQRAASYHTMYARETVLDGEGGAEQVAALRRRLKDAHGIELGIPDFSTEGMRFVRAQQLQFEGRMVLQLVYLPEKGLPVALCLTPGPPHNSHQFNIDGLEAMVWHMNGWDYALIGDTRQETLKALRAVVKEPLV